MIALYRVWSSEKREHWHWSHERTMIGICGRELAGPIVSSDVTNDALTKRACMSCKRIKKFLKTKSRADV